MLSRREFLKGTALGIASAGVLGSVSLAEEEAPVAAEEIVVAAEETADVVVVGCGAAGIMAALTTQAAGLSTIVLEKGPTYFTANGANAGGPALAETPMQAEQEKTVSVKTLYESLYNYTHGTVNGELLRKCVQAGVRVYNNFVDNGVPFGRLVDAYGVGYYARHMFGASGEKRFGPLAEKIAADGGKVEVNREAVKLVKDGDAVVGVIAKNTEDGSYIQYNAKAVLIATGGYAGNDARIREHFGDIDVIPLCNILSTGQGYDMVLEAGGIADRNWALCCNEFGGANSKTGMTGFMAAFGNSATTPAIYGGLIVNSVGDRFMNEQWLSDRPLAQGGEISMRMGKYYAVMDQEMVDALINVGILEYYGNPADWYVGQTGLVGRKLSRLAGDLDRAIEQGWAVKGSLEECAEFFGMKHLVQTVADYNACCDAGEDTLYFKSSYLLHALKGDTFYVVEYMPSCWCTFGGVKTDSYARAVTPAQDPIPGLYVAGVDNGSIYASPYYENEGASLGTAFTSGIVAGDCIIADLNA